MEIKEAPCRAGSMDVLKFVNSKDIRKHLQDIGYECSPLEAAWLIYQCRSATVEEKHAAWDELIETMPDCEVRRGRCGIDLPSLHAYLRGYMRLENERIRSFCEDTVSVNGRPYVYRVKYSYREECGYSDRYSYSDTLYSSYPAALAAVEVYDDQDAVIIQKFELDGEHRCQELYLSAELKTMQIDSAATPLGTAESVIDGVFEWLWFDFPTPFVKGDIVYDPCRTRLGPLCSGPFVMSDEGALGRLTEQHKARLKESGDTSDMCTGGYFQDEDGGLYYETSNSNYMDLEYCPEELLTGVKRIQIALGNFLKGKIDVDLLVRAYHQIRAQEYAEAEFPRDYCSEILPLAGLKNDPEEKEER